MTTLTTCRSITLALLASVLTGVPVEAQAQPTSADTVAGNTFEDVAADTVRYTLMPAGIPAGERSVWSEDPNVRHHRMSYRGASLESRLELDSAGLPRRIESTGVLQTGLAWEERFERRGDTATWSTPDERDTRAVAGPGYYVSPSYEAAFDLSLLAPALLARADRSLPLLPEGTAQLEPLGRRTVEAEARSREVGHFAIHGLDLTPEYVWLDEDGTLFADEVSVRAGWEAAFPELLAASRAALIEHGRSLFADLIPPARERPLVIQGARLFDAESRLTRQGMTIVVRGNRIAAVGPDGSLGAPAGAEVIDGTGRTVLPGLWDMHVHTTSDLDEEMEAPLYIAGGVTTVRDLGSATDVLASLRHRSDAAEAIAPRILPALIMYGPGGRVLGVSVDTPEEAREAIDRFAALGYVQIKLRQPSVRPELVPVIAERARRHGMRLSGHVLEGMTGREAIESGYDEIQHLFYVRVGAAGIRSLATDEEIGARMAAVRPGTDEWRDFVRLLLTHDVAVDPTLAVVEESVGERPPVWLARVLRQFPPQAGRMARYNAGPPAPPPMLRDHWDAIVANGLDMVRALHEAGVPLVAGTDADFGGFPLHRELEVYVEAGIPAPEVLALATLGAAQAMGMDDELGSIEPGKLADLILVDGDPAADISDIRRVVTVIKDGRVYDPVAIYRALGIEPCCRTEARSAAPAPDPVQVAPPTGDREADRASILAALEQVDPGGTVLFAPGTYVVGRFINVAVPRITLAGHADGTTIRGCDPAAFEAMERDDAVVECNGFSLTGGHQTVRDLTFEHSWHTLTLGDYTPGPEDGEAEQVPVASRPGGYVVERNTFRYTQNGIRLSGQWSEPAVIRDNRFVNTYHAVVINGMTAHVIDNEISVPEPERVPHDQRPGTPLYVGGWADVGMPACDGNVIAGNRIEGHPDGIVIAPFPGGVCRRNEIRDNTIRVERIRFTGPSTGIHVRSPSDSVLVGVPLALLNGVFGDGVIEGTHIEGNEVLGASGVAIEILGATGTRIANNLIRDVVLRDPFPGNTLFPEPPRWRDANGTGIWISPGSDDDEIVGNRFANVAGDTIVVEGEGNRVERDGDRVGTAGAPSDTLQSLPADTPYLWLENLEADTVLAWAESRTERTVERLSSGPVHDSLVTEIGAARQAARIVPEPGVQPPVMRTGAYVNRFTGGRAWMRQPAEAHNRGADEWQPVLDLDSLSRADGGRLAPESVECLPPAYERCLLRLARDGRQRIVDLREFDAGRKTFVADGFQLREAQTSAFWRDEGSLYVTTKPMGWADRALIWRRGAPLDDAPVLFTADPGDRGLKFERRGNRLLLLHARHQYDIDYYLVGEDDELLHLPVPGDVRELAFVDGRMILQLRTGWTPADEAFPSGSLIAIGLDEFLAGGRDFDLVMESGRDLVVDEIWTTRSLVIVRALADLENRLFEFAYRDGRWDRRQIDVPGSGRVEVQNSSHESDVYYFTHEDFLEPRTAYVRSESGEVEIGGRSRPAFSADGYQVQRYHATSADGTRVPYFVVHPEDMPFDGSAPAIVSGYGGNGVSSLPRYLSFYGPWLARGGAYVLANIRGGNEYGFEWHDAVRRENRQRAFDDFQAVARDLVDRKITSPGRIGTASGSNGGILVGTSFIQRPELYGAVVGFNGVFELHRCSQLSGDPPVGERGNGQDPDDWAYMRHYSPFHNLRDGEPYPAVLMLANRADDIVHPCHSRKFTAKLEDLGYEDVFYYESATGGHAKGYEPEEEAMIVGFFLRQLRPDS